MYSKVPTRHHTFRFDAFEVDGAAGELRKEGVKVPLQDVPFRLLVALLEHPGEARGRDQLRAEIWPADVHLDFDAALATAVHKVRQALGDEADQPRYVETFPGRGYRFLGAVQVDAAIPYPEASDRPQPRERRWVLPIAALVVSVLGYAGLAAALRWPPFPPLAPPTFLRLPMGEGEIRSARLLPGGREALVGGVWEAGPSRIVRIDLATLERRDTGLQGHPLAVDGRGRLAVALGSSRHASSVGTFQGTLALGTLGGSTPREVQADVLFTDFAPSGELALVRMAGRNFRLECPQGTVRLEGPEFLDHPRFSPDGRQLAFLQHADRRGNYPGRVALLDLDTGRIRSLTREFGFIRGLAWKGREVWFTAGSQAYQTDLHAVDLSGRTRVVHKGTARLQIHDIGADGRVLLSQSEQKNQGLLFQEGREQPSLLDWKDYLVPLDLSRDGRMVLGWHNGPGGQEQTLLFEATGGSPRLLAEGFQFGGTFSPDGRWVALARTGAKPSLELWPTGIGQSVPLELPGLGSVHNAAWMPDGRQLLVLARAGEGPRRIFAIPVEGGAPKPVTPEGMEVQGFQLRLSPDGRRLVLSTAEGLSIVPLDGSAPNLIPGLPRNAQVASWDETGRWLFICIEGTPPLAVEQVDPVTGRRRPWRTLAVGAPPYAQLGQASATPDGRRIVVWSYRNPGNLFLVEGLK